jgi:biopolymer transport protein ExbB/TolQ
MEMWRSDAMVLQAVERAMERGAALEYLKLRRGQASLATMGTTALFIGVFGWVLGTVNSFRGYDGEASAYFFAQIGWLSEALFPLALGLIPAILALVGYAWIGNELDKFRREMLTESLWLLNELSRMELS